MDVWEKYYCAISKHFIYLTLYIQMKIKNIHIYISYRASEQGTSLKQNTEVFRVAYVQGVV